MWRDGRINKSGRECVEAHCPTLNTNQKRLDCMPAKICSPSDPRVQQHIGKKFGLLTAVRFLKMEGGKSSTQSKQIWEFNCMCGKTTTAPMSDVIRGNYKSCGCRQQLRHGFSKRGHKHPLYMVWCQMLDRCRNPNNKNWKYYGGRGIRVCETWAHFEGFFSDMSEGYADGLTIERKDNNGNYCPENCRWATRAEQVNNCRSNVHITFNGETRTASQWSIITGIDRRTIAYRFKKGMPLDKVFFKGNVKCKK